MPGEDRHVRAEPRGSTASRYSGSPPAGPQAKGGPARRRSRPGRRGERRRLTRIAAEPRRESLAEDGSQALRRRTGAIRVAVGSMKARATTRPRVEREGHVGLRHGRQVADARIRSPRTPTSAGRARAGSVDEQPAADQESNGIELDGDTSAQPKPRSGHARNPARPPLSTRSRRETGPALLRRHQGALADRAVAREPADPTSLKTANSVASRRDQWPRRPCPGSFRALRSST